MKKITFLKLFKNTFVGIASLVLMLFLSVSAFAQRNIAPLATVTASVCNTGPCSALNDLNFGTCGTQQMWISTSGPPTTTIGVDYIQWDFPFPQTFDSLIIHGNGMARTLTGGTVQYWDGSQWVTHITFNNTVQQCISRNGIGKLTTDRFRLTAFQMTGAGQNSNPSLREIEILEASTAPNDAGVSRIDSPSVFCPGVENIWATIRNFGVNQIDSVNVFWEINGVPQGSIKINGLIDTVGGIFPSDTTIFFGSHNFQTIDTIKIYTDLPNGRNDTVNGNDTIVKIAGPSLSGTFSVNSNVPASATNFTSMAAMTAAFNTFGICGPTVVNVSTNTYTNDPIYLKDIPGTSSINTLVIDGGDSSKVIVTENGLNAFSALTLDGTNHVHLKNMTFKFTGTSGNAITIAGDAHHDTISNCFSWVNPSTNYSNWNMSFSASPTANTSGSIASYIVIQNNRMIGGYYGIRSYASTSALNVANKFINNELDSIYYYGAYIYYQDSLEFVGNSINMLSGGNTNSYGMYLYYSSNTIFSGNNIQAKRYGLYFYNGTTRYAPRNRRTEIANNMMYSEESYGMYLYYIDSVDFWHNSVNVEGTSYSVYVNGYSPSAPTGFDMRNNIFSAKNSEALYFNAADTSFNKFDYNIFYNTGGTLMNINNTAYSSLTAYQTAQPLYNTKSLQGDPNFLSMKDLHVVGYFANDVGVNLPQVTIDIDGDPRPIGTSTIVDIGADEYTPATCPPPGSLAYSNVGHDSLTIQWIPAQTGTTFEYLIVPCGSPMSAGTPVATSFDSLRIGGIVRDSCYNLYVKEICGRGDSSIWRGPLDINTGYCVPFSMAALAYINDFSTTNGDTNISNLSSGYSLNGYSDMKAKVVSKYPGGAFDFSATTMGNQMGLSIWIDWGDDLYFDPADRMFTTSAMGIGTVAGKITIPVGTSIGDYRMRVMVEYYNASPSDPCNTTYYIEAEDYTVRVDSTPSCVEPIDLHASDISKDSMNIVWDTLAAAQSFQYVLVGCGASVSTGTIVNTTLDSLRIGGIQMDSCYTLYVRQICTPGDTSNWSNREISTSYCTPVSNNSQIAYINDFTTSNGVANISNLGSGYSPFGYADNKAMVVSQYQYPNASFDYNVVVQGGTMGFGIWVDWNSNLVFDHPSEQVYGSTGYASGPFTGTITIPVGTAKGDYRMRIGVNWLSGTMNDPCLSGQYTEFEDYTIRIDSMPSCVQPISLRASGISKDSMNILWDTLGAAQSFQYVVVGCGSAVSTGTIVNTTLDSIRIGGTSLDSCYTLYVRQICTPGDTSAWSSRDISTKYCTPLSNNSQIAYINDFSTTNGNLNISNLSSGYSPNGYADNKAMVVEQYATASFDYNVAVLGGTMGFAIWIDWNSNLVFDHPSEQIFGSTGYSSGPFSGTITVPAGTPLGDYRMRIGVDWLSGTMNNPCLSGQYTEFEDYTVRVINQPTCLSPTGVSTITSSATSVDLSWTSSGIAANLEYGSVGFTPGNGTKVKGVTSPYTINGLLPNLAYDVYLQDSCGATDVSSVAGPFKFGLDPVDCDDFDNYSVGDVASQSTLFEGWAGDPGDAEVVTTQFSSSPNALKIHDSGPNFASDLVAKLGTYDSAKWVLSFDFYVPLNYGGYYNILHDYNGASSVWAIEVYLDSSGVATVQGGTNSTAVLGTYNFNKGAWNTVEHVIDLDNDTAYIMVNGLSTTVGWQFSLGSSNFGGQFNGVDFFSAANPGQTPLTYYDNFCISAFSNYPYLPIGDLNQEDFYGVADSLNVGAWTSGTVVGVDLNGGNGLGFTLIDMSSNSQEGIYINSVTSVNNYTVTEGDSLKVRGIVNQFNGLTQFTIDSIEVISTGHTIPTPRLVTSLDESTESQRIEMKQFVLLDSSTSGSYSMRGVNGTDTIILRVEAQTDVSDSLAKINNSLVVNDTICAVIGVGGQFDPTSPYLHGYRITPMYYSDLTICRYFVGVKAEAKTKNGFRFYPNPTSGEFTIVTDGLENDNAILTVRDISGKVILEENIANSNNAFHKTYNLSNYAKGLYLISILDGDKQINKKLILK